MRRNPLHGPSIRWASEVRKCPINDAVGQQECNRGSDPFGEIPSMCRSIHATGLGA